MFNALLLMMSVAAQDPLDRASYQATLAGGTVVRVTAVEDATGNFWAPNGGALDGKTLDQVRVESKLHHDFEAMLGERAPRSRKPTIVHLQIQARSPIAELGVRGNSSGGHAAFEYQYRGNAAPRQATCYFSIIEPRLEETEVDIGIAEVPFVPIARCYRAGSEFQCDLGFDLQPVFRQVVPYGNAQENGLAARPQLGVRCRIPKVEGENFETRLALFFQDGSMTSGGGGSIGPDSMDMTYLGIADLVERIEFQTRTYVWTRFKGIRLRPKA